MFAIGGYHHRLFGPLPPFSLDLDTNEEGIRRDGDMYKYRAVEKP